jgi:hypothetical protein
LSLPGVREALKRISVLTSDDVRARRVAGKALLDPFFARSAAPVNSDYFPFIDNRTARARFMKQLAAEPVQLLIAELPIDAMLTRPAAAQAWKPLAFQNPAARGLAQLVQRFVIEGRDDIVLGQMRDAVAVARLGATDCGKQVPEIWQAGWVNVGRFVAPYLERDTARTFWDKLLPPRCRQRLSPPARSWYGLLQAVGERDAQAMIARGNEILQSATQQTPGRDTRYAAAAAILGHLVQGDPEAARQVWPDMRDRLPPGSEMSIELRWLEAITIARLQERARQ